MTLVVPNISEKKILTNQLNQAGTLKLFSNNITPGETDTIGSYTIVAGGGYADKSLAAGQWTITEGGPTQAVYNIAFDFEFTGATSAPGTVYGYLVLLADGFFWAERFEAAVLPFTPANGTLIRITPKIACS